MTELIKMDGFDDCIAGVAYGIDVEPRLVYNLNKVIESLMAQGMEYAEAVEYHEYKQLGAYVANAPVFLDTDIENWIE